MRFRQFLGHGKSVVAAEIVALEQAARTIPVLLPEGNGGFVIGCGLEFDGADAAGEEGLLGAAEKGGAEAAAAMRVKDVDGEDVAAEGVGFGDDEGGDGGAGGWRGFDFYGFDIGGFDFCWFN